jgi:hypothetical protein
MLVGAVLLLLAAVVFLTGTSLGRAFGRGQAFEEAAALLRFDAARAAARGQREDALLLRFEAHRVRSASDGAPSDGEPAPDGLFAAQGAAGASRTA